MLYKQCPYFYKGVMNGEFESKGMYDLTKLTNHSVTGSSRGVVSAQVAYFFNLHGPALTIDTACSSSIVAINAAAHAIQAGIT
jgi:hybrid polyketide synthase/nonribosomal peptide synthetase ACE1